MPDGRIAIGLYGQTTYYIGDKEVSREEFDLRFPPKPIGTQRVMGEWNRPVKSDGMAVLPKQIAEAMERDRKAGVPTDYTRDGRPIFRSQMHKRQFMKSFGTDVGLHERNAFN